VAKRREGRRHVCTLNAEPFREVEAWMGDCRRFWEESFDRLESFLRGAQGKGGGRGRM